MVQLSEIKDFFMDLQDQISNELESLDGSGNVFQQDLWKRAEGGGGRTRIFQNGSVIEKGGVNFSHVHGPMPEQISTKLGLEPGQRFDATGVSIVIHPSHPMVPIIHKNIRYFQMENGTYWFGGGIDVTPAYIFPEQAQEFHQGLRDICDAHDPEYYARFKDCCYEYFYLKHRKETRGIGGLFFDHLNQDKDKNWAFVQSVGNCFLPAYEKLVNHNRDKSFGEAEKQWQLQRRSRYVEFNLLYDRGTKFGLDTGGRTESILMSMPPLARWDYDLQPEPESHEGKTLALLTARDWLS